VSAIVSPMPRHLAAGLTALAALTGLTSLGLGACAGAPASQDPANPATSGPAASGPALAQPQAQPTPAADGQPVGGPVAVAQLASGEQFQLANPSGELIPVEQVLVPGKVTVVDFYADWCAPCKVLEKKLKSEIHDEPRIAVRKLDVGKIEPEVVIARYAVKNLTHVRIYGPDGKLIHDLVGTQAEQTGRLARDALTRL
jgi:thiol-disulfide isomerase/thioredoxin